MSNRTDNEERRRRERWRLVLGEDPTPADASDALDVALSEDQQAMDHVLQALYDSDRRGGLGSSCPNINRWLGDIRRYFPTSVVRLMQQDALERLNLQRMLLEPETLDAVEADVQLVATLLSLKNVIPARTRETARQVVLKVVEETEKRLRGAFASAVQGALSQAERTSRPRPQDIDWHRTIRKNLRHYIPDQKVLIPARWIGKSRRQSALRDVILCVDQSGSMASSVVYAGIFSSVLASLRAVKTRMVVFDTEVVDLTDQISDPVDLLFATQLGGGTDIHRAIAYCSQHVQRPAQTILVLISDLFEGGDAHQLLRRVALLVQSGVQVICLLSLSDDGTPAYDGRLASDLSALGVPSFACTPDQFPDLMATAIRRQPLSGWAARHNVTAHGSPEASRLDADSEWELTDEELT